MFLSCCLVLVALIPTTLSVNPGVQAGLTGKGLDYGRQVGMGILQQKLKTITIPDISGTKRINRALKVEYSLSGMQIVNIGLPQSAVDLVPGTGVRLSISNAFISMRGNWRLKTKILRASGSFDLGVNGLTIGTTIAINRDSTGRPTVSSVNCASSVGSVSIKFHGRASWLYNIFRRSIERSLRKTLEKKICHLVDESVVDLNPRLSTLNVMAKVDQYAEIEYTMVSPPVVSTSSIDLRLKGEFYNIGKHQEPPFSPTAFSLPPQNNKMLYIGVSAFTANSAAFVYKSAEALILDITDDMIPQSSPFRLNTRTFGFFIPKIAKEFPGLMMKLTVKSVKTPIITFKPNNVTVQTTTTVTAYAIQPNATLSLLFVLNLEASVSAKLFISGMRVAGAVTLNEMNLSLATSNVGDFQLSREENAIFQMVVNSTVIPKLNVQLAKGYPLPTIGKLDLVNPQLQVLEDYMLIGTDIQFTG